MRSKLFLGEIDFISLLCYILARCRIRHIFFGLKEINRREFLKLVGGVTAIAALGCRGEEKNNPESLRLKIDSSFVSSGLKNSAEAEERLGLIKQELAAMFNFIKNSQSSELQQMSGKLEQWINDGTVYFQPFRRGIFAPELWGGYKNQRERNWRLMIGGAYFPKLSPEELSVFAYQAVKFINLANQSKQSSNALVENLPEIEAESWEAALVKVYQPLGGQIKNKFLEELWTKYQTCQETLDPAKCWVGVSKTPSLTILGSFDF